MDLRRMVVTVDASPYATRMLAMDGDDEVLRAVLGPATHSHPRAAATLLEGLALWHQRPLTVAVCVDERESSSALHLYGGLGDGSRNLHFDVAIVPRGCRRRGRRLPGLGRFGDLRQLSLQGVAP